MRRAKRFAHPQSLGHMRRPERNESRSMSWRQERKEFLQADRSQAILHLGVDGAQKGPTNLWKDLKERNEASPVRYVRRCPDQGVSESQACL